MKKKLILSIFFLATNTFLFANEYNNLVKTIDYYLPNDDRYISLGFGNYNSNTYTNGFEFMMEAGIKNNISKKYIILDNIFFEELNKEIHILMYSINYDYLYKKKYHFNPYLGIGINYIHIVEIDLITDKEQSKGSKLGTNFKTGLLYDLNSNCNINLGLKYIYINHNLIKDTYGGFIKFEFNF